MAAQFDTRSASPVAGAMAPAATSRAHLVAMHVGLGVGLSPTLSAITAAPLDASRRDWMINAYTTRAGHVDSVTLEGPGRLALDEATVYLQSRIAPRPGQRVLWGRVDATTVLNYPFEALGRGLTILAPGRRSRREIVEHHYQGDRVPITVARRLWVQNHDLSMTCEPLAAACFDRSDHQLIDAAIAGRNMVVISDMAAWPGRGSKLGASGAALTTVATGRAWASSE